MTTEHQRRCVLNVATERYVKGQQRLRSSLEKYTDADLLFYQNEGQVGAPLHKENPYAFKIYAFKKAKELGYNLILWLDASIWAVSDLIPVWKKIETGYLMQENGWTVGHWCNEKTLKWWDLKKEDAFKMPMYGDAGLLGLNFNTKASKSFFKLWEESMEAGCFKGNWEDHRHDMTNGSIVANLLKMEYSKQNTFMTYGTEKKSGTEVFLAQGI